MSHVYDVAVCGLGIMGCATVYQASKRPGLRVLGLEQKHAMHEDGSSHGESRLTRQAYSEGLLYVPLALAAHREWDEFALDVGHAVLHRSGVIYMSPSMDDPVLSGALASAKAYNMAGVEVSSATKVVEERFPSMKAKAGDAALWEEGAGWLEADNIRRAMAEKARSRGAVLHYNTPLRGWKKTAQGTYSINDGQFEVRSIVLTAGCWTQRFVPGLELRTCASFRFVVCCAAA
jgi:sarcosine oxidase